MKQGSIIVDLFGSRDGEGLAWLRSPHIEDKKVILLKGENVDVESSWPAKTVDSLTLNDINQSDFVISASPLFLNIDQEFFSAAQLTDKMWKRISYERLVYLICREAANFYYSRVKVSETQAVAKNKMIYMIREARHCGIAIALDSVRYYAIDIDIRNLADYTILKSQGVHGLSDDLRWLYSFFRDHRIRSHPPSCFYIITQEGNLGLGWFPFHSWHKAEKENILTSVGVKVEYGEQLKEPEYKGKYKTVGDIEHSDIVRLYVEEGLGMLEISNSLKRSTRTISVHVKRHNESVQRSGFCPECKRAGGPHYNEKASRGGKKP